MKTADCTKVLLCWFESLGGAQDEEGADLSNVIEGQVTPLSELDHHFDEKEIIRIYKLQEKELENSTLTDAVIFRIGAKGFL